MLVVGGWMVAACGKSAESSEKTPLPGTDVTVTVNAAATHPISPYIYGINFASQVSGLPARLTLDRAGGNRWTTYNWETNASNAGSDYQYENDAYLSNSSQPGAAVTSWIAGDQKKGLATLVTVQMQGLVAADESGPVDITHPPDMARFKKVVFQKKTASAEPFSAAPSAKGPNVYMDEFIWALDKRFADQHIFGQAPSGPRVFVQLDNEPELWKSTHLEVQTGTEISADAYITKTIELAKALKTQFPDLIVFGPGHYGFYGLYSWNGELKATLTGRDWFPDKYLPAIKAASAAFGKPLVDVYDFHWYPEATDSTGARIGSFNSPTLNDDQVAAVVQSPRSLWDLTYQEKSWITKSLGQPIAILDRLQKRIDAENPGMRLSITEYNNGGAQHIAGTIAQADNLGVFGAFNLFAANFWPLNRDENYLLAGFRAFRNFDEAGHDFGDTSVEAVSSNPANVAVYVSTDSQRPGRVIVVAINRCKSPQVTAIVGQPMTGTAHLFRMTGTSAASQHTVRPVAAGAQTVSGNSLTLTLPEMSVTTIDVY